MRQWLQANTQRLANKVASFWSAIMSSHQTRDIRRDDQVDGGDPYAFDSRPVLPYVVIDQNCLRDEGIVSQALRSAREGGELIVLTEAAFFEMMKSGEWGVAW